jgi:hypothetical protein
MALLSTIFSALFSEKKKYRSINATMVQEKPTTAEQGTIAAVGEAISQSTELTKVLIDAQQTQNYLLVEMLKSLENVKTGGSGGFGGTSILSALAGLAIAAIPAAIAGGVSHFLDADESKAGNSIIGNWINENIPGAAKVDDFVYRMTGGMVGTSINDPRYAANKNKSDAVKDVNGNIIEFSANDIVFSANEMLIKANEVKGIGGVNVSQSSPGLLPAPAPKDAEDREKAVKDVGNRLAGGRTNVPLDIIKTSAGPARVGANYIDKFQGFVSDLEATGYKIKSIGGYANRPNKSDPSKLSFHGLGAAIDINPSTNPYGTTQTDLPPQTAEIAAKWGLGWGMNWRSVKDPMHFSIAKSEGGSVDVKQLPAYMLGSMYVPKTGPAITGELGPEAIISKSGQMKSSGRGPVIRNLQQGDSVIPAGITRSMFGGSDPKYSSVANMYSGSQPTHSSVPGDRMNSGMQSDPVQTMAMMLPQIIQSAAQLGAVEEQPQMMMGGYDSPQQSGDYSQQSQYNEMSYYSEENSQSEQEINNVVGHKPPTSSELLYLYHS